MDGPLIPIFLLLNHDDDDDDDDGLWVYGTQDGAANSTKVAMVAKGGGAIMHGVHVCSCGFEGKLDAFHWLTGCPHGPTAEQRREAAQALRSITEEILACEALPQAVLTAIIFSRGGLCERRASTTPEETERRWREAVLTACGGMPHPARSWLALRVDEAARRGVDGKRGGAHSTAKGRSSRHARWRAEPATRRRASAWPSRTRAGRRHPTTRLNKGVPHPTRTRQRSQTSRWLSMPPTADNDPTLDHCGAPRAAGGGLMCCSDASV